MINFQHLIQQWAAGLLQNTLYNRLELAKVRIIFPATTNVQNACGEFRKWELITTVSGMGTWRYSFRSEDGPFERDPLNQNTKCCVSVLATQLCNENCSRVLVQWLASLSVVVTNAETARQQQV
jgi:hypothetical protein